MTDPTLPPSNTPQGAPPPPPPSQWPTPAPAPATATTAAPPPPPPNAAGVAAGDGGGKKPRKTFAIIIAIFTALALGITGAIAAVWIWLGGGGPQPADVMPDYMDVYVRFDGDPSASQKIEIYRLLRQIPDLNEFFDLNDDDDFRELILREPLEHCGIEFDEVDEWLGYRVGFGIRADESGEPDWVVAIQVTDEDDARDGINDLIDCTGGPGLGIAFHNGYAVIAEGRRAANRMVDDAQSASLADRPEFRDAFDAIGNEGILSFWVSKDFIIDMADVIASEITFYNDFSPTGQTQTFPAPDDFADDFRTFLEPIDSFAMVLRANSGSLEIAGGMLFNETPDFATTSALHDLPDDAAVGFAVARYSDSWWGGSYQDFVQFFADLEGTTVAAIEQEIERETPLRVPEDLEMLFESEFIAYLGSKNLDILVDDNETHRVDEDPGLLDMAFGLRSGDEAAVRDFMARMSQWVLDESGFVRTAVENIDGGAAIGTSTAAAQALTGDGNLGGSNAFRNVITPRDELISGVFVDIAAWVDALAQSSSMSQNDLEFLENFEPLEAFGLSSWVEGNTVVFSARLSFR